MSSKGDRKLLSTKPAVAAETATFPISGFCRSACRQATASVELIFCLDTLNNVHKRRGQSERKEVDRRARPGVGACTYIPGSPMNSRSQRLLSPGSLYT